MCVCGVVLVEAYNWRLRDVRYSDLLVENREFFLPHLYLAPRRNFVKMFNAGKTRMIGLPYGKKNYDDMLSRFHLVYRNVTDRQTDGQTDRQICYINIARQYADAR